MDMYHLTGEGIEFFEELSFCENNVGRVRKRSVDVPYRKAIPSCPRDREWRF